MLIANPIYDIIFKYMMEDIRIAKDMLSAILNVVIMSLQIQPQEVLAHTIDGINIFRIDFKAVIKTQTGSLETVLIELQKEKKGYTSLRFRRYVGESYIKEDGFFDDKGQFDSKTSLPITALYFLNFRLKNIKNPVLKVTRVYQDGITGADLDKEVQEDFVEHLSHNLYAIQIPRLKKIPMSETEQILDVFNQKKYKTKDPHVLNYTGDTSNPKVARIADRLAAALGDEKLRRELYAQDEVEREFQTQRNKMSKVTEKLQRTELALAVSEKTVAISQKAIAELEKALEASLNAIKSLEKARAESEKARVESEKARVESEKARVESKLRAAKENLELKKQHHVAILDLTKQYGTELSELRKQAEDEIELRKQTVDEIEEMKKQIALLMSK